MRFIAALLLLTAPAVASAQTIALTVNNTNTVSLSAADCGAKLNFQYTLSNAVTGCSDLQFWPTTGSCGNTPASGEKPFFTTTINLTSSLTGAFSVNASDLPAFTGGDAGSCGTAQVQTTWKVCGAFEFTSATVCAGTGNPVMKVVTPPEVTFDSLPPGVPELTNPVGHDSSASVDTTFDADTATLTATATGSDGSVVTRSVGKATRINIDGLTNGVTYTITAHAVDGAGNVSAESNAVEATPIATGGFFARYVDAGGDTGGCSAAGVGSFGSLALLGAAALILRRRGAR